MTSPGSPASLRLIRVAQRAWLAVMIVAAIVGIGAVVLSLAISISLVPPATVSDAVTKGEKRINAITGVAEVSAYTNPNIGGGDAGAWTARIYVKLKPQSTDVSLIVEQINDIAAEMRSSVTTYGTVNIPADTDGADLNLSLTGGETFLRELRSWVNLSMSLRRMPDAVSVAAASDSTTSTVAVATSAQLSETVAMAAMLAQADPEYAANVDVSVPNRSRQSRVSVVVGAGSPPPSAEFIEVLAGLSRDPRVLGINLDASRDPEGVEQAEPWRPSLRIAVQSPKDVPAIATALANIVPDAAGAPRASFSVIASTESDPYEVKQGGYVATPLEAVEPSDALPGVPVVASAQEEAAVQKSRTQIESLLQDAAATTRTGIDVSTSITECDGGPGRQVSGFIRVPLADQIFDQEKTFDDIVASWEARGLVHSDRAVGTDIYTDERVRITIRGTSEGISVSATSTCSGLP